MIVNKVTRLYPTKEEPIMNETTIQAHIDEMNSDGYNLICVDNLVGWYRFFWEKEVEGE